MLFKHFVLLLTYLRSSVLIVEGITFFKSVDVVKLLTFNIKMTFDVTFVVGDEKVHWFRMGVSHDRRMFSIDGSNFTLCSWNVLFVSISVILVSSCILNTLRSSSLRDKVLQTITHPNQKEVSATHCTEPIDSRWQVSRSIVSMHRKETTYRYTPSNGFESVLILGVIFGVSKMRLIF